MSYTLVVKAQRRRPYQMSKFVCNVAKFKGGQLYGMDIHIQRKTENHSNKDIDLERSKLNYELVNGFQNQHYFTAVKNRIEQGYLGQKQLRKDATVAVGVLVSSDKKFFEELTEEQEKDFFKTAYGYLCEKYGKDNIISAKVHKDETTPHLHAIVVPLTKDGRLSAKELFDRKALTALHKEIPEVLKQKGFNIERGESSNKKHLETSEFKKIRDENKVTAEIKADELILLKKGEDGKKEIFETHQDLADRLNQKYLKPLADELTELKTERSIREKTDNATKYARTFSKERENEFIELYHSLKEFGEKHVATVLEKLQDLVSKLNTEKRNELARQEKQRKIELEKKHQNNLFALYGGDSNLYQLLDYGKSNYEFKENGELSFYVALKNKQGEIKFLWGMEFQNEIKNFKIDEIVRLNGSKIEKLSPVRQKQYNGIKF